VRPITTTDDELYGLASAAGKLGRADKLLARLEATCQADPADSAAAGRYALAMMAVLPSLGNGGAAHARFTATIDAFGDALALDPELWLARYGRARLRTLIPSTYSVYSVQLTAELDRARDDVDHLIAGQAADPEPRPYFASAHALGAVINHLAGETTPTVHPDLLHALAGYPLEPVRFPALGAVLCEPLATLYATCADARRPAIGEVMTALYGEQAAVGAVQGSDEKRAIGSFG
jgi:hypothetical protein